MTENKALEITTRSYMMHKSKRGSQGFTLIATLLLLLLLSGIAIGMLMMVNTEAKVGTHDVQNAITFHAAEGAMEKMTSDLSNAFQTTLSPTVSDITGLSALAPTSWFQSNGGITFPVYSLTPVTNSSGALVTSYGQIAAGPYGGLFAQLLNVQLQATAQGPLGDEVNMSRTVEVALIPVFQFGVFSSNDLSYFSSPDISFAGRVHTNGDLYLGCGTGNTCTFHDKMTAYGNVVRFVLPNGLTASANDDQGAVWAPKASLGCDGATPATSPACVQFPTAGNLYGSVTGAGGDPAASGYNSGPPTWQTISLGNGVANFNGWVIDGDWGNTSNGTGATDLTLPFVNGTTGTTTGPQPFEIIRRPPAGEDPTSPLGASRLYNEASIRVFLSDRPENLPGGATDLDNVRLANVTNPNTGINYTLGVPASTPAGLPSLGAGVTYNTYFATASSGIPNPAINGSAANTKQPDWLYAPLAPPAGEYDDANAPLLNMMADDRTRAPANIPISQCTNLSAASPTYPSYPYYSTTNLPTTTTTWNLLDGYLRVEYLNNTGSYVGVTREWLGLGFARGLQPPSAPGSPFSAGSNQVNPNAILLFQQPAKRNPAGALNQTGTQASCVKSGSTWSCTSPVPPEVTYDQTTLAYYGSSAGASQSVTQFNWYPINFYDAREGEPWDNVTGDNSCTALGVMNAVELDVGNLKLWLAGTTGSSGTLVNYTNENGYILYFSDRRGMLASPNGTQVAPVGTITGDSGFEDVVNSASTTRVPDGGLDPIPAGKTISPEDANLNGKLDNFGSANLGLGLGYVPVPSTAPATLYTAANAVNAKINAGAHPNPYLAGGTRIPNCGVAQDGWVSGARHVLKLVDGSLGNVPVRPDLAFPNSGGFTIGSENPVYILGNYNTNAADTVWTTGVDEAHSAAGIIADTVTVLSNNWSDWNSILLSPTQPSGNRRASTTYYRVAVAAGKVQNFPFPAFGTAGSYYTGTDGGVHNFLHFLEDWQSAPQQNLFYNGSMVNLFYSTYNTGIMKCCNYSVYQPPSRQYSFDGDFTTPQSMPPGTPMFRDIDNLSYRQSFTPCTVQSNGVCSN